MYTYIYTFRLKIQTVLMLSAWQSSLILTCGINSAANIKFYYQSWKWVYSINDWITFYRNYKLLYKISSSLKINWRLVSLLGIVQFLSASSLQCTIFWWLNCQECIGQMLWVVLLMKRCKTGFVTLCLEPLNQAFLLVNAKIDLLNCWLCNLI